MLPPLVDGDLRLRPPTDTDVAAIAAACQDREIQRFTRLPSPYTTDNARAFVRFCTDGLANGTGIQRVGAPSRLHARGQVDGREAIQP